MSLQTIPQPMQRAFIAWLTRDAYVDYAGNYRLRSKGRVAPWNWDVKRRFTSDEFDQAADAWLMLWERWRALRTMPHRYRRT
jgi:hypothetical protein